MFNGNISGMSTMIKVPNASGVLESQGLKNVYGYDQLQRLQYMTGYKYNYNSGSLSWNRSGGAADYRLNMGVRTPYESGKAYDLNGNIMNQSRGYYAQGSGTMTIDSLVYSYERNGNGEMLRNRLSGVATSGESWAFTYNGIGEVTSDGGHNLSKIEWDVMGKLKKITKSGSTVKTEYMGYGYDGKGNRVMKEVKDDKMKVKSSEYYVRDMTGNIMSIYEDAGSQCNQTARVIYGTGRVGILKESDGSEQTTSALIGCVDTAGYKNEMYLKVNEDTLLWGVQSKSLANVVTDFNTNTGYKYYGKYRLMVANGMLKIWYTGTNAYPAWYVTALRQPCSIYPIPVSYGFGVYSCYDAGNEMNTDVVRHVVGRKDYELTNHLGNVLTVVSDKRTVVNDTTSIATVNSSTDYWAFGSILEGRSYESQTLKWGFNGKLNENEPYAKTGTLQDYGMRYYLTELGRFLTHDPLYKKYPELTPYQFASNTPIWGIDLDGLEVNLYTETTGLGHTFLTVGSDKDLTVYTYGRYLGGDKNKSSANSTDPNGRGVLIRLKGVDAQNYLKHEINDLKAKGFNVKDAKDANVKSYLNKIFDKGRKLSKQEKDKEYKFNFGNSNDAKVIDKYNLLNNNCTTKAIDAVKKGGSNESFVKDSGPIAPDIPNVRSDVNTPSGLQDYLINRSTESGNNVKEVKK